MGVTWPVSPKRMVLASYAPSKWLDRAGSEKRSQVLSRATGDRTDLDADLSSLIGALSVLIVTANTSCEPAPHRPAAGRSGNNTTDLGVSPAGKPGTR